ncbi:amidohydrolase [Caproiciproducens galactitolivorans]|uniref:Amidohydrolase family protein n=1 Tax=Caproiciproducens galactitolivorans TaxID=642589 RepID=A0ABT4BYI0_9FIRM|nr:amidohydrolase family protein [Caproiciproducens galactitolivorans]MCY1714986.1 amidohydrolase family protein [Caproiciproducens galactitolivorans]
MKKNRIFAKLLMLTLATTMFAGCGAPKTATSPSAEAATGADLVLKNGVVQTMVNENDTAQAVAVKGGKIIYVGDNAGAQKFVGDKTEVIDLAGQMVTPGFMDGHLHGPGAWLTKLYEISLSDSKTNEEYLDVVKKFVKAHPELEVYTGGRFSLNIYQKADGSNPGPGKADLDAICSDKPVYIWDTSHHSIWCNSKALEMAGITKNTPNPQGGLITRDTSGEVTGYLTDTAADLVSAKMPAVQYSEEQQIGAMEKFQEQCASYGITGFTDIGERVSYDVIKKMDAEGKLTLRTRLVPIADPGEKPENMIKKVNNLKATDTGLVKAGTVKLFYDGVTEGGTAVFLEPYTKAAGKGDHWMGEPIWQNAEYENMITALDAAGIQVHVHAIGDGAVNETLTAYEKAQAANGEHDSRHTITHVCEIKNADIQRMAKLKVVAALQFLWMYGDDFYKLESAYVGKDRALSFYPTKNMLDAGIVLAGASDGAVSPFKVLDEIEVGVTRNSPYPGEEDTDMHRWPEQSLTAYQMLKAYTTNIAYENFEEKEIGTVEVGKRADLVVLGRNILKCNPKQISDTPIVYTISDGRIVYKNAESK